MTLKKMSSPTSPLSCLEALQEATSLLSSCRPVCLLFSLPFLLLLSSHNNHSNHSNFILDSKKHRQYHQLIQRDKQENRMSTVDDNDDGMTASFSASTFESEVNDPWTATTRGGLNPIDLSTILCTSPFCRFMAQLQPPDRTLAYVPHSSKLIRHCFILISFFLPLMQRACHYRLSTPQHSTWLNLQEERSPFWL